MADIICMECKATVSDEPGYCSECGYPFDSKQPEQNDTAADMVATAQPIVAVADESGATHPDDVAEDMVSTQPNDAVAGDTVSPQNNAVDAGDTPVAQPNVVVMPQLDTILRSLSAVALEVKDLQSRVDEIKEELDSRPAPSEDKTEKILADIIGRLDAITSVQNAIKTSVEQETPQKKKKNLLAAFYRTLNSPNSMFDYMFYICVVQIIFVIANLFLAAYIVTLVR